jgi:tetratricopeptide (TPR) repeat protein
MRWGPAAIAFGLAGAALRVAPLLGGGPAAHPDEFNAAFWPLLVALGDPAPEVFYYPYLHTYLLAALHALRAAWLAPPGMEAVNWLAGQFFWHEAASRALARWVQTVCGIATLGVVGGLARQVYGPRAGALTVGLSAVSLLAVRQSPIAGLDVPMAMWFATATWAAVGLVDEGRLRRYALAGFLVGIAASTKYHGGLAAVGVVAAHLLAGRRVTDRRLWIAGAVALVAFVAGSPYTLLTPGDFLRGFGGLVEHARSGLGDHGPGWWHHVVFSLRINLGWPGLAALAVGLGLAARDGTARARVVAATFVGTWLVLGASPLVFARYALPLALLQCVLAAGALDEIARRMTRGALAGGLAALLLLAPAAHASWRAVELLSATDTRQQTTAWIEAHVPAGSRLCNVGSWPADPPLRTVEGTWWQVRRFVQQQGADGLEAALPALEAGYPGRPVYSYAVQPGWEEVAGGRLRALEEFACDYVVINRHPLGPVQPDSAFVAGLPGVARLVATFEPAGWPDRSPEPDRWPEFDPIDAYYVPVARFGDLQQPGPSLSVWRVHGARSDHWDTSARRLLAAAVRRGALAALAAGRNEDFAQLVQRADELHPASAANAEYLRRLGWTFRRLGGTDNTLRIWQHALEQDPEDARLWLELGLLAASQDEVDLTAQSFRRVLDLDPAHPRAASLRAWLQEAATTR